ncbi:MAG: hypothetical protein M1817_005539 [Caeruleum heppii]|nr:MAG: hypothetical protein M1817_005539 [Caeruleum heppii]
MSTNPPPSTASDYTPPGLSRDKLLEMLRVRDASPGSKPTFVLVDLRRHDHEGPTIKHAINLPAQTLLVSIPMLYSIFSAAGIKDVIWYCSSSRGRGPRAAKWFGEHIMSQEKNGGDQSGQSGEKNDGMTSWTLEGGINGWMDGGDDFKEMMMGEVEVKTEKK